MNLKSSSPRVFSRIWGHVPGSLNHEPYPYTRDRLQYKEPKLHMVSWGLLKKARIQLKKKEKDRKTEHRHPHVFEAFPKALKPILRLLEY